MDESGGRIFIALFLIGRSSDPVDRGHFSSNDGRTIPNRPYVIQTHFEGCGRLDNGKRICFASQSSNFWKSYVGTLHENSMAMFLI